MIAKRLMFHVVCDGCQADAQEGSDYVAWAERDTARIEPSDNGWWTDGTDRDLCPTCAERAYPQRSDLWPVTT